MEKSKKGGARNGAGRPRGARNKVTAEVKELAQEHGEEAITALAAIMKRSTNVMARIAAARELLDRAYGKATQPIAGDPDMPPVMAIPTIIELVAPGDSESTD